MARNMANPHVIRPAVGLPGLEIEKLLRQLKMDVEKKMFLKKAENIKNL